MKRAAIAVLSLVSLCAFAQLKHGTRSAVLVGDYHWRMAVELDGTTDSITLGAVGRYSDDMAEYSPETNLVVFSGMSGLKGVYMLDWIEDEPEATISAATFDGMVELAEQRKLQARLAGKPQEWPGIVTGDGIYSGRWLGPDTTMPKWNAWWNNEIDNRFLSTGDIVCVNSNDASTVISSTGLVEVLSQYYASSEVEARHGTKSNYLYDYDFQANGGYYTDMPTLNPGDTYLVTFDTAGYVDSYDSYYTTAYFYYNYRGYMYDDEYGLSFEVYSDTQYPENYGYMYISYYDDGKGSWVYCEATFSWDDYMWHWTDDWGQYHTGYIENGQLDLYDASAYFYDREGNYVNCYGYPDYYDPSYFIFEYSIYDPGTGEYDYGSFQAPAGYYSYDVEITYRVNFEEDYTLMPSFSGTGCAEIMLVLNGEWNSPPMYCAGSVELDWTYSSDEASLFDIVQPPSSDYVPRFRFWFVDGKVWHVEAEDIYKW